jgi:acetamidase/formamidase
MKKSEMSVGMRVAWTSSQYAARNHDAIEVEILEIAPSFEMVYVAHLRETKRIERKNPKPGTVLVRRIDTGVEKIVRSATLVGEWNAFTTERDARSRLLEEIREIETQRMERAQHTRQRMIDALSNAGITSETTYSREMRVSANPDGSLTILVNEANATALARILENA